MCLVCLLCKPVFAQDPIFSQYYNAGFQLNPALAGVSFGPTFTAIYRNQWSQIPGNYVTYGVAYDQHFEDKNSSIGMYLTRDNAGQGVLLNTKLALSYAYRLEVNDEQFIQIGLEAGGIHQALDWDQFVFGDQIDPQFGFRSGGGVEIPTAEARPLSLSKTVLDIGTGLVWSTPVFYAGLSAKHLTNPIFGYFDNAQNNPIGLPIRWGLQAGSRFTIVKGNKRKSGTFYNPSAIVVRQGRFTQLNIGSHIDFGKLNTGVQYRHTTTNGDALIAQFSVKSGDLRIGYSFDYTISNLGIDTGGSHEISVSYSMERLRNRPSKYNDCFQLFR